MSLDKSTLDYYNSKAKDFVSGTVDVAFTEMKDTFLEYLPAGGDRAGQNAEPCIKEHFCGTSYRILQDVSGDLRPEF